MLCSFNFPRPLKKVMTLYGNSNCFDVVFSANHVVTHFEVLLIISKKNRETHQQHW